MFGWRKKKPAIKPEPIDDWAGTWEWVQGRNYAIRKPGDPRLVTVKKGRR